MLNIFLGVIGIFTFDFFLIKRSYNENETATTDFNRVKQLYTEIINIGKMKRNNTKNPLLLHSSASYKTCKTIFKYKWNGLLTFLYTPKKLDKNILIVPYYYNGKWYYGLIQHKKNIEQIVKITTINNDELLNVTNEVLKYIGPEENFYNISITPYTLGYNNLTFTIQKDLFLEELFFHRNDTITINKLVERARVPSDIVSSYTYLE